jgi:NAD(P)H-flavin reductase
MDNTEFTSARILEITQETGTIRTYLFALEDGHPFQCSPGQFNMLGVPGVEEAAISFSSLPRGKSTQFTHTIEGVGSVTHFIERLKIDRYVMLRGPFGCGWPSEKTIGNDVLIVAGGIGLAPLKPFLLECLENRNRIKQLVLVYGARTPEDMIFKKDLAAWLIQDDVTTIYCVDQLIEESPLHPRKGLVTQFLEAVDLDRRNSLVCMCGPEIMMRFVARNLILQGYEENRIYISMERRMRCGIGHCGHCQIGAKFVCQDGPIFQYPDIKRFSDTLL